MHKINRDNHSDHDGRAQATASALSVSQPSPTGRRSRAGRTLGVFFSLAALATGCAVEEADEGTDREVSDQLSDGSAVKLATSWEPAANAVPIALKPVSDSLEVLTMDKKARGQIAAAAQEDLSWRAADGQRYSALYVAPSGKAYGRRGDAIQWPAPDAEVGRGSPGFLADRVSAQEVLQADAPQLGLEDSGAQDGVAKGRISTDWTVDRRWRRGATSTMRSVPYRMVGAMSSSGNTQSGGCTGTKIGPRAVLTAAHCVMNSNGSITTSGWFNPGQTSSNTPNGSIRWNGVFLRDWRVHRRYDYAIVFLADSAATVGLGWLGVAYWNGASGYSGRNATLMGYPCGSNRSCGAITSQRCKASPRSDKRCDGWMYGHTRRLNSSSYRNDYLLQYDNDMSSGQSGSSVYVKLSSNDRRVVAVNTHSWGGVSMGPRFRSSMWNDVCTWIAAAPSAFGVHSSCN